MKTVAEELPPFLSVRPEGITLAIKLQPRASRNEIGDVTGNELCVKVTAPPVDSAANEALIKLIAQKLDCAKGQVQLVRGRTSRHKVVSVCGIPANSVTEKLQ